MPSGSLRAAGNYVSAVAYLATQLIILRTFYFYHHSASLPPPHSLIRASTGRSLYFISKTADPATDAPCLPHNARDAVVNHLACSCIPRASFPPIRLA